MNDADDPARSTPTSDDGGGGRPRPERRAGSDRRRGERRQRQVPVPVERRSGQDRRRGDRRKRSINQYDMSGDELEFASAVQRFRDHAGGRFPTNREILQILRDLGYAKRDA